jgi:hypothetical protein
LVYATPVWFSLARMDSVSGTTKKCAGNPTPVNARECRLRVFPGGQHVKESDVPGFLRGTTWVKFGKSIEGPARAQCRNSFRFAFVLQLKYRYAVARV